MGKILDVARFDLADTAIAEMSRQYMALTVAGVDDEAGCKAVHSARMVVKRKRIEVEKKRVELKAEALAYGRAVDGEAKRIAALLEPIECHLDAQERIVTDEAKRIAQAHADAERARLEAIEQAKRDAEAARIKAEQDVERARIKAEEEQLALERVVMQAEQAEADAQIAKERAEMQKEQDRHEAEMKEQDRRMAAIKAEQNKKEEELAAAQARIDKAEADRQHAIELEKAKAAAAEQAKANALREAEQAKQREEAAKKAADAERLRLEGLRPDAEKLQAYGKALYDVPIPELVTREARKYFGREVACCIDGAINSCNNFTGLEV